MTGLKDSIQLRVIYELGVSTCTGVLIFMATTVLHTYSGTYWPQHCVM